MKMLNKLTKLAVKSKIKIDNITHKGFRKYLKFIKKISNQSLIILLASFFSFQI